MIPRLGITILASLVAMSRASDNPYFMWEASKWGPRGLSAGTATLDTAALEAALTEFSDANSGLAIAATLYDADGNQVMQTTVGDMYCDGTYDLIDLFNAPKICNETSFSSGMDVDTVIAIYSNSKVASAITFLASVVQTGLGHLDEPVSESLPEYFDGSTDHSKITPRMILTHTTGLPFEFTLGPEEFDQCFQRAGNPQPSLENCMTWIASFPLINPPGTQYENSEIAFEILAALVPAKTGMSFEDAFQQYVATPLGLTMSTYVCPQSQSTANHTHPAIGLCSTGAEFAKIVQMLAKDGDDAVLTKDSKYQILSQQTGTANLISPRTPFIISNAGGLASLRCRPGTGGEISQIGYGLGAFLNTGTRGEMWGHPSLMGAKWLIAPGQYSAYLAVSYPFQNSEAWMLYVQDKFESASTFTVEKDGTSMEIPICSDVWTVDPAVGVDLPVPNAYFTLNPEMGADNSTEVRENTSGVDPEAEVAPAGSGANSLHGILSLLVTFGALTASLFVQYL